MKTIRIALIALVLSTIPIAIGGQTKPSTDVFQPLKFFVGKWSGTGKGQPGQSRTEREYRMVLNDKFIEVKNRSVYEPQPQNPKGEVHDDWGLISFDKSRKQFVFRQFHVEGFVNQYVLTSISDDGKTLVFNSEALENIPSGFKARETLKILGADEFTEVFEIAEPGKGFEVYSENHYRRQK